MRVSPRHRAPTMKGKGSRGIPGNRGGFSSGGGLTQKAKGKFERQDFESSSEWTLVAEKDELGAEMGSTKAVEAGMAPQGQSYVWALVRGDPVKDGDAESSTVYVTDGSSRCCTYPMTKGEVTRLEDDDGYEGEGGHALTCTLCGTKYNLVTGEVMKWFPKENLVQAATALANKDKEPEPCTVLKTRVSKAGRSYVRLPDGTLPITTRRVEGTINDREEIKPAGAGTKKKSTSRKARKQQTS